MLVEIVRLGLERGRIELRQSLPLVFNYTFFPTVALVIMYFLRGIEVAGGSLGMYAIPGILAMNMVFTGFMGLATNLISEREEGTLMRARTVPYGVHTYLVGKVASQIALTLITVVVMATTAYLLFGDFVQGGPRLMSLLWLLPLGLTATLPWGAVFGSLLRHPRNLSFVSLGLMGLLGVSGVFYPLATQPVWGQVCGQLSPIYWLGLGIRGALMPDSAAAAEIGGSWRMLQTAAVLLVWSALGMVSAVAVMRRSGRREGGVRGVRLPNPRRRRAIRA